MAKYRRIKTSEDNEQEKQQRQFIGIAAAAVGVLALGYLLFINVQSKSVTIADLFQFSSPERGHVDNPTYPDANKPPAGGQHNEAWQNCGIYRNPVEAQYVVHSLEHGAVWMTYNPELITGSDLSRLEQSAEGYSHIVVSPYPNLASPIVLTAWGLQLDLDDVRDDRLDVFLDRYAGGTQAPETGASCSDGVGIPDVSLP